MHKSYVSNRLNEGIKKLVYSLLPALVAFFSLSSFTIPARLIIGWNVFSFTLTLFYWVLFLRTDEKRLPHIVATEDDGVRIIFPVVLLAVCISFLGVLLLHQLQTGPPAHKLLQLLNSMLAIVGSWFLLHTIFATRYADLYFKIKKQGNANALMFPAPENPDYVDFAYFSFVIGMTFQVSDIQINSRQIRRLVLLHSLISFAFNTVIVAITINAVMNAAQ